MINLHVFETREHFLTGLKALFASLNVPVNYIDDQPIAPADILTKTFKAQLEAYQLMDEVFALGMVDQAAFDGTQSGDLASIAGGKHDYDGLLLFGVTLKDRKNGLLPTRSQLAEITRALNREFFYTPVVVVFRYAQFISMASAERMTYTQAWREGEKVGKVSMLKDINLDHPHAGHLRILDGLRIERSGKQAIATFAALYAYWQEVFSVALLNKHFYQELANWYFWALSQVEFPDDAEKDKEVRNATNVIRLITRLIFVWFLKEKHLVPETLFDPEALKEYLRYDDSTGSTYYKAILQNLFFATLNTEMRKDNPHSRKFVSRQYGVQGFYRYSRFFRDPEKALELFQDIPFLNGGLFENLDRNVGTPEEIRIDCFSERPKNEPRLKVPDVLFFGEESECDFSAVYGDAKRKHEHVRGLINILNSYKFTIAENTPIEEEIALDPELLGKVFENLLASYNPETQTTARKQTGSFYTPREIVNYMVDESLIAYLTQALKNSPPGRGRGGLPDAQWSRHDAPTLNPSQEGSSAVLLHPAYQEGSSAEDEVRLRHLLSYSDEPHQFTDAEVMALIEALHAAKILDPACGSGAFPMGMLHKMVHILTKLDPDNIRWRETQRQKAIKETEQAFQMGDKEERDKRLLEINEVFEENASDYGRKLYLIENCIYGVDIQPIAVQIAKLRCFISLIVDQQVNPAKKNLGLLPLPNLETKFVAANTLIGIEKPTQLLLRNPEIDRKEAELRQVRQKHFTARSPKTKERARQEDQRLRAELAGLMKGAFPADVTEKLVRWNPYDQNAKADFFDAEWMFGMQDGFDIVIGNPPYVQLQNNSGELAQAFQNQHYETFIRTGDIYCLFYEKANQLAKPKGVTCYITSNKWMRAAYGEKLRKYFAQQTQPLKLIDVGPGVFEAATVDTNILLFAKQTAAEPFSACQLAQKTELALDEFVRQFSVTVSVKPNGEKWEIGSPVQQQMAKKIETVGIPLKDWNISIYFGVKTGYNEAFIIDGAKKAELIAADPNSAEIIKPLLRGREIQPYKTQFADSWLIDTHNGYKDKKGNKIPRIQVEKFLPIKNHLDQYWDRLEIRADQGDTPYNLRNCAYHEEFGMEKIVWKRIGSIMRFSYDDSGAFCLDSTCIATGEKIKFLVGVLNSKVCLHELFRTSPKTGTGDQIISVQALEPLRIPQPNAEQEQAITALVDQILAAKQRDPAADTRALEAEIDRLVYALYGLTPEEIAIVEGVA